MVEGGGGLHLGGLLRMSFDSPQKSVFWRYRKMSFGVTAKNVFWSDFFVF